MDASALWPRDDASSDGDEPTQVAMTQVAPTQVAAPAVEAAVEQVRCMICALNLTAKSILERELHLNACLDAASLETKYDCPTCGKQLTDYNEQRRMAHVNLCLDRVARFAVELPPPTAVTDAPAAVQQNGSSVAARDESISSSAEDLYECRICGQSLSLPGLESRSRHVKQCGQRFGLRASDLAAVPATAEASSLLNDPSPPTSDDTDARGTSDRPNAFAVLMSSSVRRPVPTVATNAFDVLMKSSRTEAVVQATASASTSARAFWHTNSSNSKAPKRMRFSSSTPATQRRYGCPDYKRILSTQPPFIVDGFQSASKSLSNIYFLTHFHSDHYVGLQKSFDCGVIYCNEVTAALTIQELGVDAKFVHAVPMNTPVEIRGVQVTFMDANHCPGAAIILFRLRSGVTYLHTGDFRFHPKMWSYAPLQPFLPTTCASTGVVTPPTRRMDAVYLDTTYADPKYTFPTQDVSIQHALSLVDKHMKSAKVLFLFGSYSIGKERLFMEVAQRYNRKVCVSKAKLKMIRTYAWPDAQMKLLTTEPGATKWVGRKSVGMLAVRTNTVCVSFSTVSTSCPCRSSSSTT
jgi:hypothetical protein